MPIWVAVHRTAFFGILPLPMLVNGRGQPDQPCSIFSIFQHVRRGEKLDGIRRRVAQRLQQTVCNERRNVMRLAIQHPGRLLRRQAGRKLAQKCQEMMMVVFHAKSVAGNT